MNIQSVMVRNVGADLVDFIEGSLGLGYFPTSNQYLSLVAR